MDGDRCLGSEITDDSGPRNAIRFARLEAPWESDLLHQHDQRDDALDRAILAERQLVNGFEQTIPRLDLAATVGVEEPWRTAS
jgi:hypothetical protein